MNKSSRRIPPNSFVGLGGALSKNTCDQEEITLTTGE
jgi:hypothetical protein